MATSKDTRVRVEGLSKIIASVLPASGAATIPRARGLHGAAVVDHPGQRRLRDVDEIEEMPHAVAGHDATPCLIPGLGARACVCASRAQARSMSAIASEISCSPMISGG